MTRLRSPYTVHVYGAITSREDRLVLVMELLTGGDLWSMLRSAKSNLQEPRTRRIVRDVSAGMTLLHRREVVHGDFKSANKLLDGEGRAKVSAEYDLARGRQIKPFTVRRAITAAKTSD